MTITHQAIEERIREIVAGLDAAISAGDKELDSLCELCGGLGHRWKQIGVCRVCQVCRHTEYKPLSHPVDILAELIPGADPQALVNARAFFDELVSADEFRQGIYDPASRTWVKK